MQAQALAQGLLFKHAHHPFDLLTQWGAARLEQQMAGLDAGDIQHIAQQLKQTARRA
ncbi:hypothetical protein D3C79_576390 [compost metagenome]